MPPPRFAAKSSCSSMRLMAENENKPHRAGPLMFGGEVTGLIDEHEAELCEALIACDVQHVRSKTNIVLLVLGSKDGIPAAYVPIPCVHGIEALIDRLRIAAHDAFKNQPCTICEKVE